MPPHVVDRNVVASSSGKTNQHPFDSSALESFSFNGEGFASRILQQTGRRLYTPAMIRQADGDDPQVQNLKTALHWTEEFIAKPLPGTSMKKSVCPFVRPSLDVNLLLFSVLHLNDPNSLDELYQEMNVYRDIFLGLDDLPEAVTTLKSFILLVPDTEPAVIDGLLDWHRDPALKTEWLEQGVMIGQFYSTCPFKASWDPTLLPHQSPVSFYAVRPFIPTDWRFIGGNPIWEAIYRKRFGEPSQYLRPSRMQKLLARLQSFFSRRQPGATPR